jgi:3-dehydroquinate synthase
MTHDKKNDAARINFTLIPSVGKVAINQNCDKALILEALEYYKQLSN